MTHDELLEEINRRLEVALYNGDPQSIHALRAVVEVHKPIQDKKLWCEGCRVEDDDWYSIEYPCQTIEAIEKEIGL